MRTQTKIESRFCNLRQMNVQVVLESIKEMGNPKTLSWRVKRCLDKENDCIQIGCSFCEIGGKNPF
ncbi:MAG: hypothetical protein P9M06_06380 [Candidatus Saelkia tenebricola]|nr:hypothetical protein [Candidatus Saelkia tenebricola]